MFALPGLLALVVVEFMRPQEYVPALRGVPLLHLSAGLAALGLVLDLRLGLTRLRAAPHLLLTVLFVLWCLVTVLVRAPGLVVPRAAALVIPIALYLLVAHAVQSFRAFEVLAGTVLALSLTLAVLGVHQGMAPLACYRVTVVERDFQWVYDGRPCAVRVDCDGEDAEPGAEYRCEHVGLLGTSSVNGRVRFRGTLEDPNELALVLGMSMPLALAFLERRRTMARRALVLITVVTVGLCTYFTQSRGGQVVFLTVLAVYFVRRVGPWRGAVAGTLLALPILLFGGRSGGESSTLERMTCWWVGLRLFTASPVFGVGSGQFTEHHYLTAHNSYILAAAELGVPGLLLWTAILYVAVKIPVQALRADIPPIGRTWALALLASMSGLLVGVLFLSFNYKDLLWLYLALTAVIYDAIRRHQPAFRVRFGIRDMAVVAIADGALLAAHIAYTGLTFGW